MSESLALYAPALLISPKSAIGAAGGSAVLLQPGSELWHVEDTLRLETDVHTRVALDQGAKRLGLRPSEARAL